MGFASPVLVRELLTASRRKQYFVYRTLFLLLLFVPVLAMWRTDPAASGLRPAGAHFFGRFSQIEHWLILILAPILCGDAIAGERRRGTLDLLTVSGQTAGQIIWGKLLARFLHMELLVLSGLAVASLTTFGGGVSVGHVVAMTGQLSVLAFVACAVSMVFSVLCRSGYVATLLSFLSLLIVRTVFLDAYTLVFARPKRAAVGGTGMGAVWLDVVPSVVICVAGVCVSLVMVVVAKALLADDGTYGVRGLLRRGRGVFRRAWPGSPRRARAVGRNPVAWYLLRAGSSAEGRGLLRVAYALMGACLLIDVAAASWLPRARLLLGGHGGAGGLLLLAMLMGGTAGAVAAVGDPACRNALDLLAVAPLPSVRVVRGLLLGVVWRTLPLLGLTALHFVMVGPPLGGAGRITYTPLLAATLIGLAGAYAVAVTFGTFAALGVRNTSGAMAGALLAVLCVCVLAPFLVNLALDAGPILAWGWLRGHGRAAYASTRHADLRLLIEPNVTWALLMLGLAWAAYRGAVWAFDRRLWRG